MFIYHNHIYHLGIPTKENYYGKNSSKYRKMLEYRDDREKGIVLTGGKVAAYFSEIELSPLYTSKAFPCIPSFACMLSNTENEKIKKFIENKSR